MSQFQRISIAEAEQLLAQRDNCLLLDVRDVRAFCHSHHPNAVHLTEINLKTIIRQTPKDVHMLVYCYHGNSSQDYAALLANFGFQHCYSIDGGFEAWRQELGVPTQTVGPDTAQWLTSRGFDPQNPKLCNSERKTALMVAAQENRPDLLRELLEAGVNPHRLDHQGNSALWYATLAGSLRAVHCLLYADVDPDTRNQLGFAPLDYARACGRMDIADLLVEGGAEADLIAVGVLESIKKSAPPVPERLSIA